MRPFWKSGLSTRTKHLQSDREKRKEKTAKVGIRCEHQSKRDVPPAELVLHAEREEEVIFASRQIYPVFHSERKVFGSV